jgi:hypothetical protein
MVDREALCTHLCRLADLLNADAHDDALLPTMRALAPIIGSIIADADAACARDVKAMLDEIFGRGESP